MKVVYLTLPETVEVKDLPARREAGPQEVLLEPLCIGLSGTDALRFRLGAPVVNGYRSPHIPGSEFVARVVGVGRGVDVAWAGQRVVANPVSPCFKCEWCAEGSHNLCPTVRTLGEPPVYGALQQRFCWPATLCAKVPSEIPDDVGVLLVPLATAIHIVDLAQVPLMGNVAVIGCGHLGLLLIKALRASGVGQILAVDILPHRREAALAHGATHALEPMVAEELVALWKRGGVDVAIDVSNASEGSRMGVGLARAGGKVLIAGTPSDNRVLFGAREARRKELTIQFVRRPHHTYERAVALARSGMLKDLAGLITHTFELKDIALAFRTVRHMQDGVIKAVVKMPPYEPREESPQAIHELTAKAAAEAAGTEEG